LKSIAAQGAVLARYLAIAVLCTACASNVVVEEEQEPAVFEVPVDVEEELPEPPTASTPLEESEGEVPLAVAESEPLPELEEIVVTARTRQDTIRNLVSEARELLDGVELRYVFTGKGKKEILRGRPVAFALWSERKLEWTVAHIEIPRPPVSWKPGGRPVPTRVITPGIKARHVKGTGAERLMYAFETTDGEPLKVYGRKFPVFDSKLLRKKQWRAVASTAQPIVYLPFTEDTLDEGFVDGGKDYLLSTARRAIEELRASGAPSVAYPGRLLADVVPAEVIAALAVIEQTDDTDYRNKKNQAFNEVLSQYGLKRDEAYRYSVSTASAIGAMQFTNRKGNGTYALVVRRCPKAKIDPNFERGATNIYNSMKAAICLFDIELSQMKAEIRAPYWDNPHVLGIFPVAAYNGGPRNVTRLHNVIKRLKLRLEDLRLPGDQPPSTQVACPCLWTEGPNGMRPHALPRYNNENRWYVEKYQAILEIFE
jgi:hypothetical protein